MCVNRWQTYRRGYVTCPIGASADPCSSFRVREAQQGHGQEALDGRAFGYLVEAAYLLWDIGVGLRDAIANDLKSGPLTRRLCGRGVGDRRDLGGLSDDQALPA